MKVSQKCFDLITKYEGLRLQAYKCPAGVWTIGYGHTSGVTPNMHITLAQAMSYLHKDVEKFERHVSNFTRYNWTQNEFDALVSFAFNIGSINQLTDNGERSKSEIASKMLLYCNAGGIKLQGLRKRRKEEQQLFLTPMGKNELKPLDVVVQEVIDGVWGVGLDRKKQLERAGYDYRKVQYEINKRYKIKKR